MNWNYIIIGVIVLFIVIMVFAMLYVSKLTNSSGIKVRDLNTSTQQSPIFTWFAPGGWVSNLIKGKDNSSSSDNSGSSDSGGYVEDNTLA